MTPLVGPFVDIRLADSLLLGWVREWRRRGRYVFLVIPRNGCQGFVNDSVEVIARRRTLLQRRKRLLAYDPLATREVPLLDGKLSLAISCLLMAKTDLERVL